MVVVDVKRISWGSIIAGLFTVIAVSVLLSLLGTSIGLTMIEPKSDHPMHGVGTAFIIWSVLSFIISLFLGGYVAGRLAANTGAIHGFLVWTTTLVVYASFTAILGVGILKMAGSAINTAGSAVGNVASGTASVIGQGAAGAGHAIENIFSNVEIDTDLDPVNTKQNIQMMLKQTGIDTLQPDYLQKQLNQSAKVVKQAIKRIVSDPNDADETLANLAKQLKARVDHITADINKDTVVDAIEKNTEMNRQEAEQVVDNYLVARKKIQDTVQDRLNDAEQALEKAQAQYVEFKEKAKQQADFIVAETAKLTLWTFFAFLIGAIVSAVAGCLGVRHTLHSTILTKSRKA